VTTSRPNLEWERWEVERFHQTLKRYLAKQEPATTKKQLQRQLDQFAAAYNHIRPHRSIGRRTPAHAFAAREKAHPRGPKIDTLGYRVRHDRVSKKGNLTLRYRPPPPHRCPEPPSKAGAPSSSSPAARSASSAPTAPSSADSPSTPKTTTSPSADRRAGVYDVSRHQSPMSRDITWWRGQDLNLRPSGYEPDAPSLRS
jgi:hypothetical protein